MCLSAPRLPVQHDVAPVGDEVRAQIGAQHGYPQRRLEREVEVIDGLQEWEACAPDVAGDARRTPLRCLLSDQHLEEMLVRPVLFLRLRAQRLPRSARVRQVKPAKQRVQIHTGAHCITIEPGTRRLMRRSPRWCATYSAP
jgi:hypothetical protein